MGEVLLIPLLSSSSPPTSSSSSSPYPSSAQISDHKSNTPMLYYLLAAVGAAAMALAIYNLVILNRCGRHRMQSSSSQPPNRTVEEGLRESSLRRSLVGSFKYKKEEEEGRDNGDCDECPVCLSGFEEGEEVRKLPRCKHLFHAMCIDIWLFSHFDCPICRTPVLHFCPIDFPAHSSGAGTGNGVTI